MTKCRKPQEWKSGARDHHRLAAAVGDAVDQRRHGRQPFGAGALRSLRRPGGARGEDDEARLVGRRLAVALVARRDQRLERRLSGLAVGPGDDPPHAPVDPVEQPGELLVVDQRLRPLAPRHLDQLRPGEHRVEVERAGAELGGGQRRLDEAAVVAAHDPDPVAGADPDPGERVGERVGAALELLPGERAALVDQRGRVGVVERGGGDAGRRRCPPAQEGGADLQRPVRPDRLEDAGFAQHPDLERFVRGRLPRRRGDRSEPAHRAANPIRYPRKPPLCRRFPRRGRPSPCPRWWSP